MPFTRKSRAALARAGDLARRLATPAPAHSSDVQELGRIVLDGPLSPARVLRLRAERDALLAHLRSVLTAFRISDGPVTGRAYRRHVHQQAEAYLAKVASSRRKRKAEGSR